MSSAPHSLTQDAVAAVLAEQGFAEVPAAPVTRYLELLLAWNKRMNLIGASDWRVALEDLLLDSFHLARLLETLPLGDDAVALDMGAGAGLPGIPLRMVWTPGDYYMVEVRQKRQTFLAHALGQLELKRTMLFAGPAEAALQRHARSGPVDLVVSRAFKPWPEVLALVTGPRFPLARRVVFMTNEPAPRELPSGWGLETSVDYASPLGGASSAAPSVRSSIRSSYKAASLSSRWLWIISS